MAIVDDKHVISCDGVVIWEAITNPDPVESQPGKVSYNLRIAVLPNAPELAELNQLVRGALNESDFKGVMPHGGNHPISPIDESKFAAHGLSGRVCFGAGTRLGAPKVYDINGQELQAMAYGPQLYNGAKVRLLVHAYAYSNKQKGVNFGLDGVQIIDGQAPRLNIGGGGMAAEKIAAAFGGVAVAAAPAVPGVPVTAAAFPPAGWLAHPTAAGYFYCGQEVLTEADLRAKFAPAPTPVAAPPAVPGVPPVPHTTYMEAPAVPVPVAFPPAGWLAHPTAAGYFYCGQEVLTEAQLRAKP
jgi:hypothetical protein